MENTTGIHHTKFNNPLLIRELAPVLKYLQDPNVLEVMLKPSGEVIIDDFRTGMRKVEERIGEADKAVAARLLAHHNGKQIINEICSTGANFPDFNCRVHIITPPATSGIAINFRMRRSKTLKLTDYLEKGLITQKVYDYLKLIVQLRKNIVICGSTGSGKTTLLNALLFEIENDCKRHVYIIEDTPEIICHLTNCTMIKTSDEVPFYSHQQAVKDALRMRPDSIIFGELRGAESLDLLKAWNTGHNGGLVTLHANSAFDCVDRLQQMCQEKGAYVSKAMIASAIDVIVFIVRIGSRFELSQIIEPLRFNENTMQLEVNQILTNVA